MAEFDCKKCLHEKVCALWASRESQDASCFCTDGCDYFTPTLTPPNEPLTLEELREMDGVNALWVHNLAWGLHKPRFMLVHSVSEDWWTCCDFDGFETFCADDYGERYLLYRRPPEVSP